MSVRVTIALTCAMAVGYLVAGGARPAAMPVATAGWTFAAPSFPAPEPNFGELPEWYRFRHALDDCIDSMDQEP